jgi:hypothetical protein
VLVATAIVLAAVVGLSVWALARSTDRTHEFDTSDISRVDPRFASSVTATQTAPATVRVTYGSRQRPAPRGLPSLRTFRAATELLFDTAPGGRCDDTSVAPGRRLLTYRRVWDPSADAARDQTTAALRGRMTMRRADVAAGGHVDLQFAEALPATVCIAMSWDVTDERGDNVGLYRDVLHVAF